MKRQLGRPSCLRRCKTEAALVEFLADTPLQANGLPSGWGAIRAAVFAARGRTCERCGQGKGRVCVHHINEDRSNNLAPNLEVLCHRCHLGHHATRRMAEKQALLQSLLK